MKVPVAVFGLVLEATFIVYCIYMIYLLDILDPFPREWMIPNALIGGIILIFGYFFALPKHRDIESAREEKWRNSKRHPSDLPNA